MSDEWLQIECESAFAVAPPLKRGIYVKRINMEAHFFCSNSHSRFVARDGVDMDTYLNYLPCFHNMVPFEGRNFNKLGKKRRIDLIQNPNQTSGHKERKRKKKLS